MGQSLSNILLHIIFSTKDRQPLIKEQIDSRLYGYIKAICQEHESPMVQIGGVADHIHLLVNISRKQSVSKLVNDIKSHSSKWMKTIDQDLKNFSWQSGYGVFSVGQLEFHKVIDYISKQKEHHKKITFKDEYLRFLKAYQMKWDDKYIWD